MSICIVIINFTVEQGSPQQLHSTQEKMHLLAFWNYNVSHGDISSDMGFREWGNNQCNLKLTNK